MHGSAGRWACTAVGILASMSGEARADQDGVVELWGVSHVEWRDRAPRVPVRPGATSEPFVVRFQARAGDLTAARVRIDDGSVSFVDAAVIGSMGPYDLWEAAVPATNADTLRYRIELIDGSDSDWLSAAGASETEPTGSDWELDFATLAHAPQGSTPVTGGVVFRVWAPGASVVTVKGDFNGWSNTANPMTPIGDDFLALIPAAGAGDEYKYRFNNSLDKPDARAVWVNEASSSNSVVVDQDIQPWDVTDGFIAPDRNSWVVYQLHVGTFAGLNDPRGTAPTPSRFTDVALRVQHLAELGVNCVMLNPVNEFPGSRSGGYNPITLWGLETSYGSPALFKFMVNELHKQGIAVILDTVPNHFSSSGNFKWFYDGSQAYFDTPEIGTPWGPQLDFDQPEVFDYIVESYELFLGEYRLDGLRVDAPMYMYDSGLTPQWSPGQAILREINDLVDRRFEDAHVVSESYIDSRWITDSTNSGLGFDGQYHAQFKDALQAARDQAASNGDPDMGRIANVIDGSGFGVDGSRVLNFVELHDDAWPLNGHERFVRNLDPSFPHDNAIANGYSKALHGIVLMSTGMPSILQGAEWLEDEGWELNKIDWSHRTTYSGVFDFFKDMIALRTSELSLRADAPIRTVHLNESGNVLAFERFSADGRPFLVIVNLSRTAFSGYTIGSPRSGEWTVQVNSDATEYQGSGAGPSGAYAAQELEYQGWDHRLELPLAPHSVVVLAQGDAEPEPEPCTADINTTGTTNGLPDGEVNLSDLQRYLFLWQDEGPEADVNTTGQSNGEPDGEVNLSDLQHYLTAWQSLLGDCP